jgi:hypothetical protein
MSERDMIEKSHSKKLLISAKERRNQKNKWERYLLDKVVIEFSYSKEWANSQLRFAILVLKGECGGHRWKGNLQVALHVKEGLLEHGFTWQAERIENWIHRLQPLKREVDSLQKEKKRGLH